MIRKNINSVPFLFFQQFLGFSAIFHAVTTRHGGVSSGVFSTLNLGIGTGDDDERVEHNYEIVCRALGFNPLSLVISKQVHGNKVAFIDEHYTPKACFSLEDDLSGFDALITKRTDIILMVRVADCVPIVFFDPVQRTVAMAHAGWRGTLAGIAGETVKAMHALCRSAAKDILVGIGPSIGPCCYQIQEEVASQFHNSEDDGVEVIRGNRDGYLLNLWEANRVQLLHHGIVHDHIEVARLCTACHSDLFFSYRREQGKTGRIGAFAGLQNRMVL